MKKIILSIAVVALMVLTITSCKCDEKKEAKETKTEVTEEVKEHNEEVKHLAAYQCPMKCEEDKTYDAPGQCPVCKMDLKEIEGDIDKEEHHKGDDHDHDHGSEGNEG